MKRLVIVSDLHCGSVFGITPSYWQDRKGSKYEELQREGWNAYLAMTRKWASPDILLCNGDMIEGRQDRQGGTELITTDRNVQADMAVKALGAWNAKEILMTYGTQYHVSEKAEDFEYNIASRLNAKIEGHLFFETEGININARHKVGHSSVPHGRTTSISKEMMWNELIGEPKSKITIRSHTHYHVWLEDGNGKIGFITPCLQYKRGRYGSRQCVGSVHWGAIYLGLDKGDIVEKEVQICKLQGNKPTVIKIK